MKKITPSLLVYWSLAAVGLSMIAGIFGSTQLWYYQRHLGLNAGWISLAMLISMVLYDTCFTTIGMVRTALVRPKAGSPHVFAMRLAMIVVALIGAFLIVLLSLKVK